MKSLLGALCEDFYISTRLSLKLEMTPDRETVLHFCDRIRKSFPKMQKLRRRERGGIVLEEDGREGTPYRWFRLEPACLRFGFFSPPDAASYREFAEFILEQAPYHLTLSDLDIDQLEVVYGFDMEYRGNHDQLVAETFFADHPLSAFILGDDATQAIDCQPFLGISLSAACDVQAYVEVKGRTSTYEVRTGEYDQQLLSVFLIVRKYWGFGGSTTVVRTHADLCRHADRLATKKVVPILVNPLAQAIISRP